jgi:hypothetical protein
MHNKVQRNEFLDNGDGLELTRGAAFNLVADNVFRSTDANKFSLAVDASKLAAMPVSFTATLTSADGATSEFSQPITLSE